MMDLLMASATPGEVSGPNRSGFPRVSVGCQPQGSRPRLYLRISFSRSLLAGLGWGIGLSLAASFDSEEGEIILRPGDWGPARRILPTGGHGTGIIFLPCLPDTERHEVRIAPYRIAADALTVVLPPWAAPRREARLRAAEIAKEAERRAEAVLREEQRRLAAKRQAMTLAETMAPIDHMAGLSKDDLHRAWLTTNTRLKALTAEMDRRGLRPGLNRPTGDAR